MLLICFIILSVKLGYTFGLEEITLTIPDGVINGTVNQTVGTNSTFYAFRGIPYAQPPVGNLRFANPVKNYPWNDTLDATKDKDICTQTDDSLMVIGSEDCLHINVYTKNVTASLPVMVWIYGGAFIKGDSTYETYAPDFIIDKDVVYTSFNYRLGVFGFLSTEDTVAPGNWGIKDQVLALQWVQDNIAYFGGDPTTVTVFGESAGAASISYLLQTNKSTGLFRSAIMESGTSVCLFSLMREATEKAFEVGTALGKVALTSLSLIDQLRTVDYKQLKMAEYNVTTLSYAADGFLAGLPFGVVKEPVHADAIFSGSSHQLLKSGAFHQIPLIIGFNSNEGAFFESKLVAASAPVVWSTYELDNAKLAPKDLRPTTLLNIAKKAAGAAIRSNYFDIGLMGSQNDNIVKFFSVDQFVRPIRESVSIMSNYTNVYYYKFSYEGSLGNPNSTHTGVEHTEELKYIFARQGDADEADSVVSDEIVTLWTNFAKNLDPSSTNSSSSLGDLIWEPNAPGDDTSTTIKYLSINKTLAMETNPDQIDWQFYVDSIYAYYGVSPYATF